MCYGRAYGWQGSVPRRYLTREEKREILEEYAGALESELKGVRERIRELQAPAEQSG